jgi:serine/threonine protein kinase
MLSKGLAMYAHSLKRIHRNITAGNTLVTSTGLGKLCDLGECGTARRERLAARDEPYPLRYNGGHPHHNARDTEVSTTEAADGISNIFRTFI